MSKDVGFDICKENYFQLQSDQLAFGLDSLGNSDSVNTFLSSFNSWWAAHD